MKISVNVYNVSTHSDVAEKAVELEVENLERDEENFTTLYCKKIEDGKTYYFVLSQELIDAIKAL